MGKSKSKKDGAAGAVALPPRLPGLTDDESRAFVTALKKKLDSDVKTFVDAYMATTPPESDDDLVNDFERFTLFASRLPGSNKAPTFPERPALPAEGTLDMGQLTSYFAACLVAINPRVRHDEWERLLNEVFVRRYGYERVYIKKRPAAQLLADAKRMSGAELMKAHPDISRSYAYKLRKAALKRK